MVFALKLDSWKFDLQFVNEKAVISLRVNWRLYERKEPLKASFYLQRESYLTIILQKTVYSTKNKTLKLY